MARGNVDSIESHPAVGDGEDKKDKAGAHQVSIALSQHCHRIAGVQPKNNMPCT